MATKTEPKTTPHTLDVEPDDLGGYSLHITGSKPLHLGAEQAEHLGRYLMGERVTPSVSPAEPYEHEELLEEPVDASDAASADDIPGIVTDANGTEHTGLLPVLAGDDHK